MLRVGAGLDAGLAALLVHLVGRALPQGCGHTAAQVRRSGSPGPCRLPSAASAWLSSGSWPRQGWALARPTALPRPRTRTHSRARGFASASRAGRPGCSGVSTRTGWHRHSSGRPAGHTQPGPSGSSAGTAPWARRTRRTPGSAAGRRSEPGQRATCGHGSRPQPTPRVLTWKAGGSGLRDPVRPCGLAGWPRPVTYMLGLRDPRPGGGLVGTDLVGVVQRVQGGVLVGFQELAWGCWMGQGQRPSPRMAAWGLGPTPTYRPRPGSRWSPGRRSSRRARTPGSCASAPAGPAGGGGGGAHTRSRARSAPAMQAVSTLPAPPGGLLFSWVILIFKWGGGRQ